MQVHDRGREEFGLCGQPAIPNACDFSGASDDALTLARPFGDQGLRVLLSAMALVASFGLGWAAGQIWPEAVEVLGLNSAAQKPAPLPRLAKTMPTSKHRDMSKPSLAAALQAPRAVKFAVNSGPTIDSTIATAVARVSSETTGTVSPVGPSLDPSSPAAAALGPLAPAPETRPTTIPGWTVVDVREGAAVLDGPDGPRMGRRGDNIPGIGRVDSIVRWGNRWIVATSNGLIASP